LSPPTRISGLAAGFVPPTPELDALSDEDLDELLRAALCQRKPAARQSRAAPIRNAARGGQGTAAGARQLIAWMTLKYSRRHIR